MKTVPCINSKIMETIFKILICDDNEFVRTALEVFISGLPEVEADLASDGKEGLHKLMDNDYDLVIMDMQMPVFSGLELIRYLREKRHSMIPVIVLTGRMNEQMNSVLKGFEVNHVFTKPFAPKEIEAAIIHYLQSHECALHN